ncbi:MAG: hypothetical protein U0T83_06015 [Bacteriovoracaceae bacterium]
MINRDEVQHCTDIKKINEYARSSDLGTVVAIAKNRHTPAGTLDMLTKHFSIVVRHEVAKHPNTDEMTLKRLITDKDMLVRDYAKRSLEKRAK